MRKYLTERAWESASPYDDLCDEERCVWKLQKKRGKCPQCCDTIDDLIEDD